MAASAIVEGAGGWRVPLHPAGFLSDLPERLGLGVVLVVWTKLDLGIGTSKRNRTALLIEYDPQALSPGHRQLSGESEFRSNLYGDTTRLYPCGQCLVTRPGQHTHDAHNR